MIQDIHLKKRLASLAGILSRRATLRAIFQAFWLAVVVFIIGLGLVIWRGWPLDLRQFALAGAAIGGLYILIDLLLNRINLRRLAYLLDRRLNLHEQTATAVDVANRPGEKTYLDGLLIQQASVTLKQAENRVRRVGWIPWRELETLFATLLIAVGVYALIGLGVSLPGVTPRSLPALPNPAAKQTQPPRLVPQPGGPGDRQVAVPGPGLSDSVRRALEALAGALGDQATTAATAEALRQGDIPGAAEALRRLADQVNSLSPGARRDLSQALRRGEQATQRDAPSLSDQLRRSASGVERGGTQAQRGLEDLARELERLAQPGANQQAQAPGQGQPAGQGQGQNQGSGQQQGQQQGQANQGQDGQGAGQGQGQGAGQGAGQQTEGTDDRAGAEGVPVELAAQPDPSEPTTRRADPEAQPKGVARGGQFGQGGAPGGATVEAAADPLRYPWDLRSVVQDYFTPTR